MTDKYSRARTKLLIVLLFVMGHLLIGRAQASTVAFGVSGGQAEDVPGSDIALGYSFTVNTPIDVTALGLYDYNGTQGAGSFSSPHDVTIWNSSGTIVASAHMAAWFQCAGYSGCDAWGPDGFRYKSLGSPVLLNAGTYIIGAQNGDSVSYYTDPFLAKAGVYNNGAAVTYGESLLNFSGPFNEPNTHYNDDAGYFGPNFQFEAAVPLPGSLALFVSALGVIGMIVKQNKKRIASENGA